MAGTYLAGTAVKITESFTVNGVLTNPTTVTFTVQDPLLVSTSYVFGVAPEVTRPSTGVYVLQLPAQNTVGVYHYSVVGTGAVEATSQGDFVIYGLGTEPGAAQPGPCSPWADASDVASCLNITLDSTNNDTLAANAVSASQILFELGGRRHSGLCSQTVRPTRDNCSCWPFQQLAYAAGGSRWIWTGWSWDFWYGGWQGLEMGCGCLSQVKLAGYPVHSIVEVKIDGNVVSPTTYRLDNHRWLTRTNDQFWPACQDMSVADTDVGSFSVEYLYGTEPPLIARQAAAQLAGELYQACTGGECSLPMGVSRVARQGIVQEKNAFFQWARVNNAWNTGIAFVDAYLGTYNQSALQRRPVFTAPSTSNKRRYPYRAA